ncbi:hypothetical protein D3C80_2026800 [compost metagenome]
MFGQVLGAHRALDDEVQCSGHQQAHVGPQAAQVVGAASASQDEIQRIADGDHQDLPGEAAVLVQLVAHAGGGASHGDFLQV